MRRVQWVTVAALVLAAFAGVVPLRAAEQGDMSVQEFTAKLDALKSVLDANELANAGKVEEAKAKLASVIEEGHRTGNENAVFLGAAFMGNMYLQRGDAASACRFWLQARDADLRRLTKEPETENDKARNAKTATIIKTICPAQ